MISALPMKPAPPVTSVYLPVLIVLKWEIKHSNRPLMIAFANHKSPADLPAGYQIDDNHFEEVHI